MPANDRDAMLENPARRKCPLHLGHGTLTKIVLLYL